MTRIFKRAAAHTLTLFSSLAVLGMALPAQAQTSDTRGPYATIGITQLSADLDLSNLSAQGNTIDLGEETVKVNMITGRVGYRIMDFLAIEGEAGFGLGGDSFERTIPVAVSGVGTINVDTDVSMDVSNYGGVFARGILPLGDQFEIFARAGYGFAKAEADVVGTVALLPGFSATASESDSVNDFAYGIGAQFNIDDTHGVRLDYSSIGSEVSVVSLSYAINF